MVRELFAEHGLLRIMLGTEDDRPLQMCQLRRVLTSGESVGRQCFILTTRYRDRVMVEDSASPIRDAKGELAGAVMVIVEVTGGRRIDGEREHSLRPPERSDDA